MENLTIRKVKRDDLMQLLWLYTHLHENAIPTPDDRLDTLWQRILNDPAHNLLVGTVGSTIVSTCVALVVPNLTRGQRSYMLIENVVTHPDHRNRGYATALLRHATDIAERENCYKIMLLTGAKDEKTLDFYRRAGFDDREKTAFIRRFDR